MPRSIAEDTSIFASKPDFDGLPGPGPAQRISSTSALGRASHQRHVAGEILVLRGRAKARPSIASELLGLIAEDADHFGGTAEVQRARGILSEGTSAHRQLAIWREAQAAGANDALRTVVDGLAKETVAGT